MKINFLITSNEANKTRAEEISQKLVDLAANNNIDVKSELVVTIYYDNEKENILITPTLKASKNELILDKVNSFHRAYLSHFVDDNKIDLLAMDIK